MADREAPKDDTYDPSTVEVDRGRQQGLGMGQKDLDYQRDPGDGVEPRSFGAAEGDDRGQAGPPGQANKAYDERDKDEVSFSQPSGGAGG